MWGIHRGPVNSPHKWPVTRKMFPFDDVIMFTNTLVEFSRKCKRNWNSFLCQHLFMSSMFRVISIRTSISMLGKELIVHWSAPNSPIRSYLCACRRFSVGYGWESKAFIIPTYRCQKGEHFSANLFTTVLWYAMRVSIWSSAHGHNVVLKKYVRMYLCLWRFV